MSDEQIKHMVDRFLSWRLPEDFSPDCGIHFDADAAKKLDLRNQRFEPVGTNLFNANQAAAMVRHMIEGLPDEGEDIGPPTPLGALKFRMEQGGYTQPDLAKLIGSRARASEILAGRRELSKAQIAILADTWDIPARSLLGHDATNWKFRALHAEARLLAALGNSDAVTRAATAREGPPDVSDTGPGSTSL